MSFFEKLYCLIVSSTLSAFALLNGGVEFFIVIPTYRNASYCIENIESLCKQTYPHWRAAIIVDGAPEEDDGTYALLAEYISTHGCENCITLQRNTRRCNSLANINRAIKNFCPSDDCVVVIYDGDDYFLHDRALERIAREYEDPTVWLTYGQYLNIPQGSSGICRCFPEEVLQKNSFRSHPFISSHPRTFYAWLYKQIREEDLQRDGSFFTVTGDVAMMLPMLEMAAKEHIRFIPDPLYAYRHHDNNDYAVRYRKLVTVEKIIRQRSAYKPLGKRPH